MKKSIVIICVLFVVFLSVFSAKADTYDDFLSESQSNEVFDSLPDDAKSALNDIGIDGFDYKSLENIKPDKITESILNAISVQGKTPLRVFLTVISVMLLYSILYGLKNSLDGALQPVMSLGVTLCITCVLVLPLTEFITSTVNVIITSSDFMLAYVPLMVLALGLSGQPISGAGYYSVMIFTGQAVGNIASKIVAPFLKIFLALGISSAISPNINLSGMIRFISKLTKIILAFSVSIFTGVLSFKQVISMGADTLSSRAVRFSISSFVPIVGSALSEAYRTVQGSVGLLKSGIGIVSVVALLAVYLPVIVQALFWMLTLALAKAVGEVLNLREPCVLLESVYTVISTLFSIILCMIMIFIISSSAVVILGGFG